MGRSLETFNAILGDDDDDVLDDNEDVGELVVREVKPKGLCMDRPKDLRLGSDDVERLKRVTSETYEPEPIDMTDEDAVGATTADPDGV